MPLQLGSPTASSCRWVDLDADTEDSIASTEGAAVMERVSLGDKGKLQEVADYIRETEVLNMNWTKSQLDKHFTGKDVRHLDSRSKGVSYVTGVIAVPVVFLGELIANLFKGIVVGSLKYTFFYDKEAELEKAEIKNKTKALEKLFTIFLTDPHSGLIQEVVQSLLKEFNSETEGELKAFENLVVFLEEEMDPSKIKIADGKEGPIFLSDHQTMPNYGRMKQVDFLKNAVKNYLVSQFAEKISTKIKRLIDEDCKKDIDVSSIVDEINAFTQEGFPGLHDSVIAEIKKCLDKDSSIDAFIETINAKYGSSLERLSQARTEVLETREKLKEAQKEHAAFEAEKERERSPEERRQLRKKLFEMGGSKFWDSEQKIIQELQEKIERKQREIYGLQGEEEYLLYEIARAEELLLQRALFIKEFFPEKFDQIPKELRTQLDDKKGILDISEPEVDLPVKMVDMQVATVDVQAETVAVQTETVAVQTETVDVQTEPRVLRGGMSFFRKKPISTVSQRSLRVASLA